MDVELAEAFRRGEAAALERVYREHIASVEALVRRVLNRASRFSGSNLADLVQEVFMKAFSPSARLSYDGTRDYAPYLHGVAKNVVIDWLRRTGREVPEGLVWERVAAASAVDGVEEQLFPVELVQAASDYVRGLSPELRDVHEHRFVAAEPQNAAAEALGISRQNLRTLEGKLLRGLRRELARLAWSGLEIPQPKRGPNA
jgi:RNA polymerase sigma factor (sigma-70 family)